MPRNRNTTGFRVPQICIQLYAQGQLNSTASASVFQFLASSSISGHFSALIAYLSRMHFLPCFKQILASAISTLLLFLKLKFNDHTQSVFETHRAAMLVTVASSVVYFSAYAALLRFPLHSLCFVAHRLVVMSGYISIASLASVLLTNMAATFLYAVSGLLLAAELLLFWEEDEEEDDDAEFWVGRNGNGGRHLLNYMFGGGENVAPTLPI